MISIISMYNKQSGKSVDPDKPADLDLYWFQLSRG